MKKIISLLVAAGIMGGILLVQHQPAPSKPLGASAQPQGFLSSPSGNVISPGAPKSASCSLGGSGANSSVDGSRIAELTWSFTNGTNGLIRSPSGWFGYAPTNSNNTASESFSVPITGSTQFIMTVTDGQATSTCSVTLS